MTERINLEVPASLRALSTVRMVLGGLGARLDFSIDDLEDLYLATEELLRAALRTEGLDRIRVEAEVDGAQLRLTAGLFSSPDLRRAVEVTLQGEECLDLCTLLHSTIDEVTVDDRDAEYCVVLVKRRAGAVA
jgi:anti-sigma regulatory factor (Ser/Thr protein kinase)